MPTDSTIPNLWWRFDISGRSCCGGAHAVVFHHVRHHVLGMAVMAHYVLSVSLSWYSFITKAPNFITQAPNIITLACNSMTAYSIFITDIHEFIPQYSTCCNPTLIFATKPFSISTHTCGKGAGITHGNAEVLGEYRSATAFMMPCTQHLQVRWHTLPRHCPRLRENAQQSMCLGYRCARCNDVLDQFHHMFLHAHTRLKTLQRRCIAHAPPHWRHPSAGGPPSWICCGSGMHTLCTGACCRTMPRCEIWPRPSISAARACCSSSRPLRNCALLQCAHPWRRVWKRSCARPSNHLCARVYQRHPATRSTTNGVSRHGVMKWTSWSMNSHSPSWS